MKVIISGGGTGGHVFPAIAIADALKAKHPDIDILFVGAQGKLEMEKVPKAGYPIEGLWISGFHRKLTARNLLFPLKLVSSLAKAYRILQSFQPDVAVGVGGYASGATLEVASRLGIPTLIQEQNSYAGVTNKLLAKKANTICVAYDGMDKFFPKEKIVWTGNPVRQDIPNRTASREEICQHFGLEPDKKTLFLFGGSLGARTINEAIAAQAELLEKQTDVQVLWQAGKLYIDEFAEKAAAKLPNVHILEFVDRMDLAYAVADVIVGRAGALTISELSIVGKPAILVPSPNVAEDHQTMNAMALVEKDAAILVKDSAASEELMPTALDLLENVEQQQVLSENIRQFAKSQAAQEIAAEVEKLGRKNKE